MREEIDKIKAMPNREKREYIWDYYKIHIIAMVVALFFIGMLINDIFINPPPRAALTIAWRAGFEPEQKFNQLTEAISFVVANDNYTEVSILDFSTTGNVQLNMARSMQLIAMMQVNDLDIFIANKEYYDGQILFGGMPYYGFKFIMPMDGSTIFADLDICTEDRYLGVFINTEREEAVQKTIELLWADL